MQKFKQCLRDFIEKKPNEDLVITINATNNQ